MQKPKILIYTVLFVIIPNFVWWRFFSVKTVFNWFRSAKEAAIKLKEVASAGVSSSSVREWMRDLNIIVDAPDFGETRLVKQDRRRVVRATRDEIIIYHRFREEASTQQGRKMRGAKGNRILHLEPSPECSRKREFSKVRPSGISRFSEWHLFLGIIYINAAAAFNARHLINFCLSLFIWGT